MMMKGDSKNEALSMKAKRKSSDLSLKHFAKSFASEAFHLDNRIVKSICVLFVKPGYLTTAYFRTRDRIFIQPLRLYFLINFLFFLVTPILNTQQFQVFSFNLQSFVHSNSTYQNIVEKEIQKSGVSEQIYKERFNAHLKYNQPAFVFLVIPLFALFLNIVHIKKKRYYVEHLYFSVHFMTLFLLTLLILSLSYHALAFVFKLLSISSKEYVLVLIGFLILWLLFYLVVSSKAFYKIKFLTATFTSTILFAAFVLSFGLYVHFLFFYTVLALKWGY